MDLDSGIHADLFAIETTGASALTAKPNKLDYQGVPASRKVAEHDKKHVDKFHSEITAVGKEFKVSPAIIAAIMSRESRGGFALRSDGFGNDGHGFGVMQVDDRYHKPAGGSHSIAHIRQAVGILVDSAQQVKKKHPTWSDEMICKGSISAYNFGVKNVRTIEKMDVGTTGNDYANDVIARAQYYAENGY